MDERGCYLIVDAPGASGRKNVSGKRVVVSESADLSERMENADAGHDRGENVSETTVEQHEATGSESVNKHAWRAYGSEEANGSGSDFGERNVNVSGYGQEPR